jgi:hypothetical protein
MHVCVYVCVHICKYLYVCMYVCMYMFTTHDTQTHRHTQTHARTHALTKKNLYIVVCVYKCILQDGTPPPPHNTQTSKPQEALTAEEHARTGARAHTLTLSHPHMHTPPCLSDAVGWDLNSVYNCPESIF